MVATTNCVVEHARSEEIPDDVTTPGIALARLCSKVEAQTCYALWIAEQLLEKEGGEGLSLLVETIEKLQSLAEELEPTAEQLYRVCQKAQLARVSRKRKVRR